jgi:hypothetical protein
MSKYPPEALEPENLASVIDGHGKMITNLENSLAELEFEKVAGLEAQLKAVAELHLRLLEENTAQIGIITEHLNRRWKLSEWLAKLGL